MTLDPPIVRLELESRPETPALVRAMLGGLAERLGSDPELLDDLKTAVSEACNNVVLHAYPGAGGPLTVLLYASEREIEVVVRDRGTGIPADAPSHGVGIRVVQALAERATFWSPPGGGTEVSMTFAAVRDGKPLLITPPSPAPEDAWERRLAGEATGISGDVVGSVSPVGLLTGVLGRLGRALAIKARFSLDRFADVYLVTDAVTDHAARNAQGGRIAFAISARAQRLELKIGPLRAGPSAGPDARRSEGGARAGSPPLALLSDELEQIRVGGSELLRVALLDPPRSRPPAG